MRGPRKLFGVGGGGWGWMRDNFVCWEGEGGQMPINGNFTMKIVLFKFSKGEGGGS